MSSLFATSISLSPERHISIDEAVCVVKRRSTLTHTEARLVVHEYVGYNREQLAAELKVSIETLKSYWRRVYKKVGCQRRGVIRSWVVATLRAEFEPTDPA